MDRVQELENKFHALEKRISKIEKNLFEKGEHLVPQTIGKIERFMIENIEKISIPDLILISLKQNKKQTREEIKKTLEDWGKIVGDWFTGGNLNNRLVKTNLVTRDDGIEGKEDTFSLKKKGNILAEKLIDKLSKQSLSD